MASDFPGWNMGGDKAIVLQLQIEDGGVIANLYAQLFGAAEVGIDQRLAAAHEKRIGPGGVQCAGQRRLEMHAMAAHPVPTVGGRPDHQARQFLVGLAIGYLEQVLPELFLRIRVDQHILRRIVHAPQITRVLGVATSPDARCGLQ
ncbi:hypothetical protein D3C76_1300420 [compost metagenome]